MRFIFFVLSILILLLVGAVVGPSFVDWNKYKPQIIDQVKNATGLDVTVTGDLSLAVFPSPHVKIEDLVVAAPLKKKFENLLVMKSAEVSVQLMPLLKKEVKVSSVTLVSPDIQIEILQDGTPSWTTDKLAKVKKVTDAAPDAVKKDTAKVASNALESIALDRLEIKDGKLQFINHQTGSTQSAQDVNVVLKADSLKGPFDIEGGLIYQDKKIAINGKTGKLPKGDEGLTIQGEFSLPDAETALNFNGVTSIKEPYDVQGQTTVKIGSPAKFQTVTGISLGGYGKSIGLDGLLTANKSKVTFDNLKLSLGEFIGNGKISIQNLENKNPLKISGEIKSSSVLNLNDFMKPSKKTAHLNSTIIKTANAASDKALVPQALTLPMAIDADVKFDLGGLKYQGQLIKGVFLDLNKTDKVTKASFKALELPGQGKADGVLNVTYASSSQSSKTGQVIYSDPSVSYVVNGQANQLSEFLKAFAPDADTSAVTKLYKTAQFNLKGGFSGSTISLKESVLKLDDMVVGLGGSYKPAVAGGRAKAAIDISADTVDFDRIMQTQGKKPASSNGVSTPKSTKEVLEPVQGFSLPLDLTFDVSLQKARINGADLNGLRLTGDLIGSALNLKTASVNNFAGATISAKGKVGNLSDLTGLDLSLYTKTDNLGQLASALKADISKLPAGLKALEATVSGKGNTSQLNFNANVKALGGQLEASGIAKGLLGSLSYNNLAISLKHPNLVKAIQIVNPSFSGQTGLNQAIDFYSKANIDGKKYDLSDMKVTLGSSGFGGDLKINAGADPVSVRGKIVAGKIALDSLLGAKKSSGGSSSTSSSGGSSTSSSGDKWSTAPIDLGWMKTLDVDVGLSATSVTYGAWNFVEPSTDLKISNGQLNINQMKAGVFGGQATLTTQVNASPVSLSLSSAMNNINVESLAKALSGGNKLKAAGTVNFDMNVKGAGASSNALVNSLDGKANLNGTDVIIKGFDLVKLARGLAVEEKFITSARSLVDGALNGGQTKFDTVKGVYDITKGKVVIASMAMDNVEAVINSTGYADLPSWFINVDNIVTLKNVTDLEPFEIKIKGSLSNPKTLGTNVLEDYLGAKLKRKLAKELPDVLGDDVTDKLKQFGILPKDKVPAEAVPAPTTGDTSPAPQPVTPAPAQQNKIEKPEDVLKGVLEGLF